MDEQDAGKTELSLLDKLRAHVQRKATLEEQLEEAYRIITEQTKMLQDVEKTVIGYQMMAANAFVAGLRATDEFWNGANPNAYGIEIEDDLEVGAIWNSPHIKLDRWKPCNMYAEWSEKFLERYLNQQPNGVE